MMLGRVINKWRAERRIQEALIDEQMCEWCIAHSFEMANRKQVYHTEDCYLGSWVEGLVCCYSCGSVELLEKTIVYNIFATSHPHYMIMKQAHTIGYGYVISGEEQMYITVRGLIGKEVG